MGAGGEQTVGFGSGLRIESRSDGDRQATSRGGSFRLLMIKDASGLGPARWQALSSPGYPWVGLGVHAIYWICVAELGKVGGEGGVLGWAIWSHNGICRLM